MYIKNNKILLKNIAIIGGHGFIGKNLCNILLEENYNISLIGNNSGHVIFPSAVKSISVDVKETDQLIQAVAGSDVVIWLASSIIPGLHEATLQQDFERNVRPIISFLEKADQEILQSFVYLSSGGTVYGDTTQNLPLDEDHPKQPISEYGLSKLVTENYIEFITKSGTFESFILRPSNVYGPYQNLNKPQGIIGFAFKSLIDDSTLDLYDDGKVVRDFVSVADLASAVIKCIEKPKVSGKTNIYNVGSGEAISIKVIIHLIGQVAGSAVQTQPKSSRKFDCEYNVLSIDKIKSELGWSPKVKLEDGLKEVWEWIKDRDNG